MVAETQQVEPEWRAFGVEWRSTYVVMSIDCTMVFDSRRNAPAMAIPHTPMHVFLQQELGLQGNVPAPNSSTPATVVMHVDWVSYTP